MTTVTTGERGAGAVLLVGVVAALFALTLLLVPLGVALTGKQRAAAAADAAALAAADAAVGIRPGSPCAVAAELAASNAARLEGCVVEQVVVTVTVVVDAGALPLSASATAGPPAGAGR